MKLSVFYDHITEACTQRKLPVQEVLKQVRDAGITGIEINLSQLLDKKEEILENFRDADLCISSIYEFYDWGNQGDLSHGRKQVETAYEVGAGKDPCCAGLCLGEGSGAVPPEEPFLQRTCRMHGTE